MSASGTKQTSACSLHMSAYDPKPTLAAAHCDRPSLTSNNAIASRQCRNRRSASKASLSHRKKRRWIFYKDMWDHADKSLIPKIFHEGFTFRGSLGPTLVGHDQLAGYVDWVAAALGQYTTDILAMIEEGSVSAARCVSTAIIGRNCSVWHRVVATYGGLVCRFSRSTARRCATCTSSATFMA